MAARALPLVLTIGEMIERILDHPEPHRVWLYVGDGFTLCSTYTAEAALDHSCIGTPPERPHLTVLAIRRVVIESYHHYYPPL